MSRNRRLIVDLKQMRDETCTLMGQFGIDIDPDVLVEDLSSAFQQIVEIIKTVSRENLRMLVLDKPTAPLTTTEVDILFQIIAVPG